jgi:antitoxin CptB
MTLLSNAPRPGDDLETRKKRLKFQCWHRGFKELDLILGHFADQFLDDLSESDTADLENLLRAPDHDIYGWINSKMPVEEAYDTPIFQRLKKLDFMGVSHRTKP